MHTEIEAKFTDINKDEMRKTLLRAGAKLIYKERLTRSVMFRQAIEEAFLRVRDEGDQVTVTYKHLVDRTLHGTKELNVIVNNFDQAVELLELAGLKKKSIQETRREAWTFNECQITLDTWPWIPTFLEIEGPSEDAVRTVAHTLELEWQKALYGTVEPVYQQHYNVTEEEIHRWPAITFTPVPDWLEKVRK